MKLLAAMADKEFKYSDYIGNDILKQYGLMKEMYEQMLTAIEKREFKPALKERMSMRICDYSVWLLHDMRENTKENGGQDHYEQRSKRYGIGHSADSVSLRHGLPYFCGIIYAYEYIRNAVYN